MTTLLLAEIGPEKGIDLGVALGLAIGVACSWQRNRSILWAILAGILGWIYVIYFAFTRREGETK